MLRKRVKTIRDAKRLAELDAEYDQARARGVPLFRALAERFSQALAAPPTEEAIHQFFARNRELTLWGLADGSIPLDVVSEWGQA